MRSHLERSASALTIAMLLSTGATAQQPAATAPEAEIREAIRQYDVALGRGDAEAAARFWAPEYFLINPRGLYVTRAERIANLGGGRTVFDSLTHAPQEERFQPYGNDLVVYTALLTLGGRYSGQAEQGRFRAMVLWVRRDGRWQQAASQLTPISK
jgi:ketosteroid isomerase-like protein